MANGWHRKRPTPNSAQRTKEYNSAEHKQARKDGKALVASGRAFCWRCGKHIPPGSVCGPDWHVGHDAQRVIRGPECASCNLSTAARLGARIRNAAASQGRTRLIW